MQKILYAYQKNPKASKHKHIYLVKYSAFMSRIIFWGGGGGNGTTTHGGAQEMSSSRYALWMLSLSALPLQFVSPCRRATTEGRGRL